MEISAVVLTLLTWIGAHSGYDTSQIHLNKDFRIKVVSQVQLQELYFIDGTPAGDLGAVYEPFAHTVYLSEKFNSGDEYENSLLLHELVHVLQDRKNRLKNRELYKAADVEAYRLQARYLREKGLKMEALLTEIVSQYLTTEPIQ